MSCLKAIIDVLPNRDYSDEITNKEHHPLIAISEQTRKLNRSSRRSLDATRGLLSCGSSFTNSTPIMSSTSGSGSLSSFGCVAHDPGHNALLVNRFSNDVGFSSSLWTGGLLILVFFVAAEKIVHLAEDLADLRLLLHGDGFGHGPLELLVVVIDPHPQEIITLALVFEKVIGRRFRRQRLLYVSRHHHGDGFSGGTGCTARSPW